MSQQYGLCEAKSYDYGYIRSVMVVPLENPTKTFHLRGGKKKYTALQDDHLHVNIQFLIFRSKTSILTYISSHKKSVLHLTYIYIYVCIYMGEKMTAVGCN